MFDLKKITAGGETYHVHEISVRARRDIFAGYKEHKDAITMSVSIVLAGCAEFLEKDSDAVLDLPGTVFDIISAEIVTLSGMGDKDDRVKKKE